VPPCGFPMIRGGRPRAPAAGGAVIRAPPAGADVLAHPQARNFARRVSRPAAQDPLARPKAAMQIVDNFSGRHFAPPKRAFLPFRQAKTALALAPEGVTPQNVKMGMTKCAPF
jgi:hypothetical protein